MFPATARTSERYIFGPHEVPKTRFHPCVPQLEVAADAVVKLNYKLFELQMYYFFQMELKKTPKGIEK